MLTVLDLLDLEYRFADGQNIVAYVHPMHVFGFKISNSNITKSDFRPSISSYISDYGFTLSSRSLASWFTRPLDL